VATEEFSVQGYGREKTTLPIPPHNKGVYFLFLFNILKEVQNRAVKSLGVGYSVVPGKHRCGAKGESELEYMW
jgi:hypothetical protein